MPKDLLVDVDTLRTQVRDKYRKVALDPRGAHHFHTGRPLAARLGYEQVTVDSMPDRAVESFAGVGNPFSLRHLEPGERVVDVGSGAGFDSFIAATQVGPTGTVVGIDMTAESAPTKPTQEIPNPKGLNMATDDKVVIGQTHGTNDPEAVLIGYPPTSSASNRYAPANKH